MSKTELKKRGEEEQNTGQKQLLKGRVRWHNTLSKTPESSVSLTGWEYEQGSSLSIKKSIEQENIVWA